MRVGDTVNNYEILELISGKKNGYYFYRVRAKCLICGTNRVTTKSEILSTKQRCGIGPCHRKFINIKGKRFGNLVAEEYVFDRQKWEWKCKCDCGKIVYLANKRLTKEGQVSCKKCADSNASQKRILPNEQSKKNKLFSIYKRGAKQRTLPFELSLDNLLSIIIEDCFYCGEKPSQDNLGLIRNGIDRVDSTKGYIKGNVVPCCFKCNQAKSNFSQDVFYDWIYKLYHNLHNQGTFNDYPKREYIQVGGNGEVLNK